MGAEGNNRNEVLSRIIADLSAGATGGENLSSQVDRLRDELKKAIGGEDTVFGKLRGLVESFRQIIPDENRRYQAAITAMSTTAKLNREQVVGALNNQLAELKILEKGLLSTLPGWRDELKIMETKSHEIRDEIANLREKIGQLESEEKIILKNIAAREKEMEPVEKAVGDLFSSIGAEIAGIRQKIEGLPLVSEVPQPVPSGDSLFPRVDGGGQKNERGKPAAPQELPGSSIENKTGAQPAASGDSIFPGDQQTSEDLEPPASPDSALQKKCPMCGGRMDFNLGEHLWQCYSCGHEETGEEPQGPTPGSREPGKPSAQQDTATSKKCPMCGGRMDFNLGEHLWRCYSCGHEEKGEEPQGQAPGSQEPGWPAVPLESVGSAEQQDAADSKKCPMCGGRMDFNLGENLWRCYSCGHEDTGGVARGNREESIQMSGAASETGSKSSPPSFTVPLADMGANELRKSPKRLSQSKPQPSLRKKTCPACGKKMILYEMENAWRCPFCEYERRI